MVQVQQLAQRLVPTRRVSDAAIEARGCLVEDLVEVVPSDSSDGLRLEHGLRDGVDLLGGQRIGAAGDATLGAEHGEGVGLGALLESRVEGIDLASRGRSAALRAIRKVGCLRQDLVGQLLLRGVGEVSRVDPPEQGVLEVGDLACRGCHEAVLRHPSSGHHVEDGVPDAFLQGIVGRLPQRRDLQLVLRVVAHDLFAQVGQRHEVLGGQPLGGIGYAVVLADVRRVASEGVIPRLQERDLARIASERPFVHGVDDAVIEGGLWGARSHGDARFPRRWGITRFGGLRLL